MITSQTPGRAVLLLAGLLIALTGCGKKPKAEKDKPTETKDQAASPTSASSGPAPTQPPAVSPPTTGEVKPQDASQLEAEAFIRDLRTAANAGPLPPDFLNRVSPAFLKVIGKPTLTGPDRTRGYSAEAAEGWLRRAGMSLAGVGVPTGHAGPAGAAFIGTFSNPSVADGRLLLRLVLVDGKWKVDWLQLGTVKVNEAPKPAASDEAFQDFSVQSFLDALSGRPSGPLDDQVLLFGALLSPKLQKEWAPPFSQDKDRGYDYSVAKLKDLIPKLADAAKPYARTRTGPGQFKVELTKDGKPRTYHLKLVQGPTPSEWLVDEFVPQ